MISLAVAVTGTFSTALSGEDVIGEEVEHDAAIAEEEFWLRNSIEVRVIATDWSCCLGAFLWFASALVS
jgi:hypothetical protein